MKRTLFLTLGLISSAWADNTNSNPEITLDDKLYAERDGTLGSSNIIAGENYIEYHKVSGSGDFYLSADMNTADSALALFCTNIWLSNEGDTPLNLKDVNIENSATSSNGKTKSCYGILIEKGEVVVDGVQTGDLQSNLSIGTAIGNHTAQLTIKGGSQVQTTTYYNTIGGQGSEGILNVEGYGTEFKTNQITLGSSQCLTSNQTIILSGDEMSYDGIRMTVAQDVWDKEIADGKSEGHGTLNITDGAAVHIGEGNSDQSTNKLQIFNGTLNVDGKGSQLIMHKGTYLTMDPNYGTISPAPNVAVKMNITDGGKVINAEGEKSNYLSVGYSYDDNVANTQIAVDGESSSIDLAVSKHWWIDSGGSTVVQATNKGTIKLNADEWGCIATTKAGSSSPDSVVIRAESGSQIELLGTSGVEIASDTFAGSVTLEAKDAASKLAIKSEGSLYFNYEDSENINVSIKGSNGASVSLTAGEDKSIILGKGTQIDIRDSESSLETKGTVSASAAQISIGKGSTWTADKVVLDSGSTLNNDGTLSGSLSVAADAQVSGSGTFSGLEVADGATLVVGNSPGLQSYSESLTLSSGSTTVFSVAGFDTMATADNNGWDSGTYSSISLEEGASLSLDETAVFEVAFGGDAIFDTDKLTDGALSYSEAFSLTLIQNAGTLSDEMLASLLGSTTFCMTSEAEGLPTNGVWNVSVTDAAYKLVNNNLVLTGTMTAMIPEPTTATLSLLALAALAARRRRASR